MTMQWIRLVKRYSEPIIWFGALLLLFFMDGGGKGTSLCLWKAMGFTWCPGCGIGHSIHHTLHLNFTAAVEEHILGIPATLILLYQCFKSTYIINKNYKYGPATNFNDVS